MNSFKSVRSYLHFERYVKLQNRYFRDNDTDKFLNTLLDTSNDRIFLLKKSTILWRAQAGYELPDKIEDEIVNEISGPFRHERMKPLKDKAKEGRANPKGISYLYLSTTQKTSLSETRPWIGSLISLGKFRVNDDLKIFDFTRHSGQKNRFITEPDDIDVKNNAVWIDIDNAFSKPTSNDDSEADYVPTQIIAEFIKQNAFDGIMYKSSLDSEGKNITLFDISKADLEDCCLFELNKMNFEYNQASNPYSVELKKI